MACANSDYACELVDKIGLTGFPGRTVEFLLDRPLKILLIIVVAWVLARILARLVRRSFESVAGRTTLRRAPRAQARTTAVAGALTSMVRIVVWTIAGLSIVGEFGINLGPFIAGASIVGVALGFGAQSLVRDFLSGFFILVEDQYGVGDKIAVAGSEGTVEEINLRMTRLRSADGTVWFVPNGEIRKVANATIGWARAVADLLLPLDADIEAASAALADEAAAFARDPAWSDAILEPPEVLGVEAISADGITVRVAAKTLPLRDAAVARQLRARLGARLRREGIALAKAPAPSPSAEPAGDAAPDG
jgi:moderate conductance mechanosensitive channel